MGTPAYMAPEQITASGRRRADVFALRRPVVRVRSGMHPFHASTMLATVGPDHEQRRRRRSARWA
jgi:serine/threonine protein kinase